MAIIKGFVSYYDEKPGRKPGSTSYRVVIVPEARFVGDRDYKGTWFFSDYPLLAGGAAPAKGSACTAQYEQKGKFNVIGQGGFVLDTAEGTPAKSSPAAGNGAMTSYTDEKEKRILLSVCMKEATAIIGLMAAAGAAGVKTLVSSDKHAVKLAAFHKKLTDELYFANLSLPTKTAAESLDAAAAVDREGYDFDDDIPFHPASKAV